MRYLHDDAITGQYVVSWLEICKLLLRPNFRGAGTRVTPGYFLIHRDVNQSNIGFSADGILKVSEPPATRVSD